MAPSESTLTTTAATPATRIMSSSPKAVIDVPTSVDQLETLDLNKAIEPSYDERNDEGKEEKNDTSTASTALVWSVKPASQKSLRTQNPIRAIVDPIVKNIQSGAQRGDGKDHISLAVRPSSRKISLSGVALMKKRLTIAFTLCLFVPLFLS